MLPNAFRALALAIGAALFGGASCNPSGAKFAPATGVLTWNGTGADELVEASVSGGAIVLNGGQIPIQGGVPTLADTTRIVMNGRAGNDYLEIDASVGAIPAWLIGGAGADTLVGGAGDDEVVGGPGTDVALLGGGDDRFVWNPGDEADFVVGEEGFDTLASYGDETDEDVGVAVASGLVQWVRSAGPTTTELAGVEAIDYFALGGADDVVLLDLTGGDVTRVRFDFTGANAAPDEQLDTVYVWGTPNADEVELAGDAAGVVATGLPAQIEIVGQDPTDRLTVDGRQGADVVFSQIAAGAIRTVFQGQLGDDLLIGGPGDEEFIGGDGGDSIMMGGGDDHFTWNPGDDADLLDGGDGFDTLLFNGAGANETIDVSALGDRVRVFRDVANVVLELDGVEALDLPVRGGGDFVRVNDLSATDLVEIDVDLSGPTGAPDAAVDHVVVLGTPGDDTVQVFGNASLAWVAGLATQVTIANADGPNDYLTIATYAGDDVIHAAGLAVPSPTLTADGGDDDDILIGGDGADVLIGGNGNDVLMGGPGVDVLDGGPGDNVVIQ